MITRHRGEFEVRLMCRVLEVSPSGYYASRKRPPSWHALIDEVLMAHVRIIHAESGETYGAPRVHRELQAEGLPASPKRVARLMREDGLVARPRETARASRRPIRTTTDPIAPNLLARQFDVNGVGINRVWVARPHVHPDARRHAVPGDRARSRLASLCGLGDAGHAGSRAGAQRAADGARGAAARAGLDAPFGSRDVNTRRARTATSWPRTAWWRA